MGEMRRAIAREEQERAKVMEEQKRSTDRLVSAVVIAASIIAAVRLAGEQDISRPIASSEIRDNGQHWAGENDPRKDCAQNRREDGGPS